MSTWLAFALLLVLAGLLLWAGRQERARTGLPAGRVVSSDTGAWKTAAQSMVASAQRLVGKPDYVVESGGRMVPIEVKLRPAPDEPYPSHVMQLAAYCMLVEATYGRRPTHGLIHYSDRTFAIDYTRELEAELLDVLGDMRDALICDGADRSHEQPARCRGCGYLSQCDQGLA